MNLACILKKTQSNRVNRCITPSLIKESTSTIKVVEISLVGFTAEEVHVTDLEVRPEMAGRVAIGLLVMLRSQLVVHKPFHHVVVSDVFGVFGKEAFGLGPQARQTFRCIEEIDCESVRLVVILHVVEDVVVDVAVKFDLGFDSPVVSRVGEGRMLVKHSTVPSAHFVVRGFAGVLKALFFEVFVRFFDEIVIDPFGRFPVIGGDLF